MPGSRSSPRRLSCRFDTETDRPDYIRGAARRSVLCDCAGEAAYVPLGHDYRGRARAARSRIGRSRRCKPLLEDEALPKLGHQLKFDTHILANHGIALRGQRYDSMLESYVLDSVATGHDMDSMAEKYLGLKTMRYEDVAGKGAKQLPFNQVDVDRAAEYAARGCRRHAAAASGDLAAARGRAALEESLRDHRAAARAGALSDGAHRRAG